MILVSPVSALSSALSRSWSLRSRLSPRPSRGQPRTAGASWRPPRTFCRLPRPGLSGLGSLLGPLEVSLALLELLGDLLVLSVGFLGLVSGLLEFILELGHSLLVFLGLVLEDLLHTLGIIGGGGSLVELLVGNKELLLGLLEVLLKSLHPPVEGVDLGLGGHQGLLLLFELEGDEGQSLGGDVELSLELPGLVHQLKHLLFGLLGTQLGN